LCYLRNLGRPVCYFGGKLNRNFISTFNLTVAQNIVDHDTKVYSTITCECESDHLHLQKVIDHIKEWCDQWLLPLNINKCSHMSYTSRLSSKHRYCIPCQKYRLSHFSNIQKVDQIKDLGILYNLHLTFKDHVQEKINKAYTMIGLIKRNFIHMDSRTFIMLYKALVCPHVEYANSVW